MTALCPECRQMILAKAAPPGVPIPTNVPEDRRESFREFMGLYHGVAVHLREFHEALIKNLESEIGAQLTALMANLASIRLMEMVESTDPEFVVWGSIMKGEARETIRQIVHLNGLEDSSQWPISKSSKDVFGEENQ